MSDSLVLWLLGIAFGLTHGRQPVGRDMCDPTDFWGTIGTTGMDTGW